MALKNALGKAHHIHLYTGRLPAARSGEAEAGRPGRDSLSPPRIGMVAAAGLAQALFLAKDLGLIAGVEIPSINARLPHRRGGEGY